MERKIKEIVITDTDSGEKKVIKSGDSKVWRQLSFYEKSCVKEVLRTKKKYMPGWILFEPVFE